VSAIALFWASAVADQGQLQRQLDYMVAICRAEQVVRLVAHGTRDVEMQMVRPGALPSVSENKALDCTLSRVRARKDLQLGFTGNEVRKK
jgi:hypothetical protein